VGDSQQTSQADPERQKTDAMAGRQIGQKKHRRGFSIANRREKWEEGFLKGM